MWVDHILIVPSKPRARHSICFLLLLNFDHLSSLSLTPMLTEHPLILIIDQLLFLPHNSKLDCTATGLISKNVTFGLFSRFSSIVHKISALDSGTYLGEICFIGTNKWQFFLVKGHTSN